MEEKRKPTEKKQVVTNISSTIMHDDDPFDVDNNKFTCVVKRAKEGAGGFKDVAGMSELKIKLDHEVLFPLTDEVFKTKYNGHALNGILLYGPPGCGKTFLAEKFAEESRMNYMLVKSSDLASTFIHGTQEKIRKMFDLAERLAPCILCIDELDAIAGKRSSMVQETYAMEVNEMLSQLNNCSERGIFVIYQSARIHRSGLAA